MPEATENCFHKQKLCPFLRGSAHPCRLSSLGPQNPGLLLRVLRDCEAMLAGAWRRAWLFREKGFLLLL